MSSQRDKRKHVSNSPSKVQDARKNLRAAQFLLNKGNESSIDLDDKLYKHGPL